MEEFPTLNSYTGGKSHADFMETKINCILKCDCDRQTKKRITPQGKSVLSIPSDTNYKLF